VKNLAMNSELIMTYGPDGANTCTAVAPGKIHLNDDSKCHEIL
jgi:hypothetical protein